MKDIFTILSDAGVELTEEQKKSIKSGVAENYRTINDYDNVVKKRDEYKQSLDDATKKLEGFADTDVDDLKGQITQLKNDLAAEKADREKEATRRELETLVDNFLNETEEDGSKKREFVNSITADSIKASLMAELEKDTAKGKSVEKLFDKLTTDKDGNVIPNIMIDKTQQDLENNKPKFTTRLKSNQGNKMTREQIDAIKDRSERQAAIAANMDLYTNN